MRANGLPQSYESAGGGKSVAPLLSGHAGKTRDFAHQLFPIPFPGCFPQWTCEEEFCYEGPAGRTCVELCHISGWVGCGAGSTCCPHVTCDPDGGGCSILQGHCCRSPYVCGPGFSCICPAGLTDCNGDCVNISQNPSNCGRCGNLCPPGFVCTAGSCGCPSGTTLCSNSCVDTQTDPQNCGRCGVQCGPGKICSGGTCVCDPSGGPPCASGCCPSGSTCCGNVCCPFSTSSGGGGCCGDGNYCPSSYYCGSLGTGCCPVGSIEISQTQCQNSSTGVIFPKTPESPRSTCSSP